MSDKLTNSELKRLLVSLAAANAKAWHLRDKLSKHCEEVYGVDPAAVDNDWFIDAVDGGCGAPQGMSVKEFHESMLASIGGNAFAGKV